MHMAVTNSSGKVGSGSATVRSPQEMKDFERELVSSIPFLRRFSNAQCRQRDLAEDMLQETLAKAWRYRDQYKPGTKLKAWLVTILRHEFCSHMRRAWRETQW